MKGLQSATLWIVIILVGMLMFINLSKTEAPKKLTLAEWCELGKAGQVVSATDDGGEITGEYRPVEGDDEKAVTYQTKYLPGQEDWIAEMAISEFSIPYDPKPKNTMFSQILFSVLIPVGLILILWVFLMRQLQGGSNKAMNFGRSKAKLVKEGEIKVTFKDVAGIDEACEELEEIVEYLKEPKKFTGLGAKIPKGVLLVGPPGTGKTLLARAIAGEAGVPFFSLSGSDFVEMFVGVGASRVRDLFEQAKKAQPCIIFIDEIDAVGRSRFAGMGGGHDEREQTLNQLLVEMDGFTEGQEVVLVAATNRPDVLDPALLRPGRFDRQVMVDLPDIKGREQILTVHSKKIKLDETVVLSKVARGSHGFSGADLANLINEAALLAARRAKKLVGMNEIEEARDRVLMGPERRSMVITEKEKLVTAYHEVGHALIAHFTPGSDPVHKITIVPRGRALGLTWILPKEDRHNLTRQQLFAQLAHLMGGRAAEEIQFGEFTTGASNDIERATALAQRMVCQFGMSDRLGPRAFGQGSSQVFLAKDLSRERNYSEETASVIDEEVKRLIDEAHSHAMDTLREKRETLDCVAEALVERETLDDAEFLALIEGRELPPLKLESDEPPSPPTPPPLPDSGAEKTPHAPGLGGPQPQPSV